MPINDIREFINRLEAEGELVRIKEEIDWDIEAGAIMRKACELKAPSPLFEKIKGYPQGHRILGSPLATFKRLAIASEMDLNTSYLQFMDTFEEKLNKTIKPNLVSKRESPCKENIILGDKVDLFGFPVPLLHPGDGGRYMGTFHIVAFKDPDSGWVNWGMYRLMVSDKETMTSQIFPFAHSGLIYSKYEKMNKPMEFAVAIGTDPITSLIATWPVPDGISEVDVIGSFRGEPLPVVQCETVDLVVPATSEIVLEGIVPPHERKDEGPFSESVGYRASPKTPRPFFQVKAITHRHDPIFTASCTGVGIDDSDVISNIAWATDIRAELKRAGLPITGFYIIPESCECMIVVATRTPYANIAARIASVIWGHRLGFAISKVLIVDEDVDPSNMEQVIHAFGTKCHPVYGIHVIPRVPAVPIMPYLWPHERKNLEGANVYFDCTWPKQWPPESKPERAAFEDMYPVEIKEKVLKNWGKWGFLES